MIESKILHLDMNCYFATLEQQAYPNLRGLPIGIAGKGKGERTVVCSASIEAKKLGVKSGMSTWEAVKYCPGLILIPATYERYIYISQKIFQLLERFAPKVDVFSIDEAFLDLGHDISWLEAERMAMQMKALIKKEIGEWVTCSIGISYGKTLAKLASEMQKPDGLTVIKRENFAPLAKVTPIEELCGIGFRLRPRLNRMGINTIYELSLTPKDVLVAVFGDFTGSWLHNISNGRDDNILRSFRDLPQEKSIGHSYTLPRDITSPVDIRKVLLLLSERVGVRLRHKNLTGRTIAVYLRFFDQTGWGQRQAQKEHIFDGYEIYRAGERIISTASIPKAVRLIAISITDLVEQAQTTTPLFQEELNYQHLIGAVDKINDRWGEWTVHRGSLNRIKQRIFNLPDGRDKRKFVPEITHINPFTKRI